MSASLRRYGGTRAPGVVALAFFLGVAFPAGALPTTVQTVPQRAAEALQEVPVPSLDDIAEPIREGIERVRRALERDRNEGAPPSRLGAAYGILGALYHAHGYPAPALAAYANARLLDPADRRWAYYSGVLYAAEGQTEAAIAALLIALAAQEDLPTLLRLAELRLAAGEADEARRLYTRALELDSGSAAAHFGLGRLATDQRQWNEAVSRYERALEIQPQATAVHYPLGQVYRALGRLDEAEHHLSLRGRRRVAYDDPLEDELGDIQTLSAARALFDMAGNPDRVSDLDYLGFALNHFGNMEGAAEGIEEMLHARMEAGDASPTEMARLHLVVASLWERRASHDRALEHLRTAVTLDPDLLRAQLELGHVLARQGAYDEALSSYDQALALDPSHADALFGRAAAAAALGNDARARTDLEKLLSSSDVDDPAPHLLLARVLERAGESEEAARRYRRALELAPSPEQEAGAEAGLGRLSRGQRALAEAVVHFERAAALLPEGPPLTAVELDLGAALAGLDRYQEAARSYGHAVARAPRSEPAQLGLVSALLLAESYAEAAQRLRDAHRVLPESAAIRHLLARFLAAVPQTELRDGEQALALAEVLFAERRDAPRAETLAMALAQAGRFQEASRLQRNLVEEAARGGASRTADRLRDDLARYETGVACCARSDWTVLLPPLEPVIDERAP